MPSPGHKSIIQDLADSLLAHRIVMALRLPGILNFVLGKMPLRRRLPRSRSTYRLRKLESLIVADEIFGTKIYQQAIGPNVRTLMDIGCNIGFFSLACAEETGRKDLVGIAIDANPEMAQETRWHLRENGLTGIEVIHGLAGAPVDQQEAVFYVSPSNIASSALNSPNPNLPAKGDLAPIHVPAIDLAAEWKKRHGDLRIDVLKIDVEGFEKHLIENSPQLLALADVVIVDIHKWVVSAAEIELLLRQNGFERYAEEGESVHCVLGFFKRK